MIPIRIRDFQLKKEKSEPIAILTSYDATFAKIVDRSGVDAILVGDSLGMVIQGHEHTLCVSIDEVAYHVRAVARGVKRAHLIADMPFMTYQQGVKEALENAALLLKAGAHAVKLEGGAILAPTIQALTQVGIPVMGHIGLMGQSVHAMSGYRIQGKTQGARTQILEDALALQEAGVYSMVLECIPEDLATEITRSLKIPTIGIGAGSNCDGQILVVYDVLNLNPEFSPKFVKRYLDGGSLIQQACEKYVMEVKQKLFPDGNEISRLL